MSIQNIIFDLGGVLIDWDPRGIVQKFSADPVVQEGIVREVFDHSDWADKDRGDLTNAEAKLRFVARTGLSADEIDRLMQILLEMLLLKEPTLRLMDELKEQGYPLYCLSNMPVDHYDYLRQKYDFWDRFEGIVISGAVRMVKPEPRIYEYTLREYQLDPAVTVFIDDSPKNIEVAQTFGIQGIVFSDVEDCRKKLEQLVADMESKIS